METADAGNRAVQVGDCWLELVEQESGWVGILTRSGNHVADVWRDSPELVEDAAEALLRFR